MEKIFQRRHANWSLHRTPGEMPGSAVPVVLIGLLVRALLVRVRSLVLQRTVAATYKSLRNLVGMRG
jgi:hypothetical protein